VARLPELAEPAHAREVGVDRLDAQEPAAWPGASLSLSANIHLNVLDNKL
jgi:hypothetical protein